MPVSRRECRIKRVSDLPGPQQLDLFGGDRPRVVVAMPTWRELPTWSSNCVAPGRKPVADTPSPDTRPEVGRVPPARRAGCCVPCRTARRS